MKLELYPATEADWFEHRKTLEAAGKSFRRVWADVPASGAVAMCIKVPKPGRYGLVVTHDLARKNKVRTWKDGAGVRSHRKPCRSQHQHTAGPDVGGRGEHQYTKP